MERKCTNQIKESARWAGGEKKIPQKWGIALNILCVYRPALLIDLQGAIYYYKPMQTSKGKTGTSRGR
jgi:hypothetical protein